jgi:hypothetical protein
MSKVHIAPAGARVRPTVLAFALLEIVLVAAAIALLQRHVPWDGPRFAAFVCVEVAAILVALAFNFVVLPGRSRT